MFNLGPIELVVLLLIPILLVVVLVFLIRRGFFGPPKFPRDDEKK